MNMFAPDYDRIMPWLENALERMRYWRIWDKTRSSWRDFPSPRWQSFGRARTRCA